MIVGVNRVCEHEGREYHIQAEDLGVETAVFEIRVYLAGSVLWRKRVSYADLVGKNLGRLEQDDALRSQMEKTLQTVRAAIVKGKLA
jgi:hypothetical protein